MSNMQPSSDIYTVQIPQYLAQIVILQEALKEFSKVHNHFERLCIDNNLSTVHILDNDDYRFVDRLSLILEEHISNELN